MPYYNDDYEYSPEKRLLASTGNSLANILGGYLGARLERSKQEREKRSIAALARAQDPSIVDNPEFQQMAPTQQRKFLEFNRNKQLLTSRQDQKAEEEKTKRESAIKYAEEVGSDPAMFEGWSSKDIINYVKNKQAENQKLLLYNKKKEDKELKKLNKKAIHPDTLRVRTLKKQYQEGKLSEIDKANLDGTTEWKIITGQPLDQEISKWFKDKALNQVKTSASFYKQPYAEQLYRLSRATEAQAKMSGYEVRKKSRKEIQEAIKQMLKRKKSLEKENLKQQELLQQQQRQKQLQQQQNLQQVYQSLSQKRAPIVNPYAIKTGLQDDRRDSGSINEMLKALNRNYR